MSKKIYIRSFCLLFWVVVAAVPAAGQHYIGMRGGYGLGTDAGFKRHMNPPFRMKSVWGLWSGGLVWKYYSPQNHYGKVEKHFAGISMEVEFLQKAYEFYLMSGIEYSETSYRRTFNSIHVPIIWQPHINMAGNRLRIFFNAGVWACYNLPEGSRVEYFEAGVPTGKVYDYEFNLVRDNPFGYGLLGGIGFDIALGERWSVSLEGRYYHSFGDILRSTEKYNVDPVDTNDGPYIIKNPFRSPPGNINISVGVLYRLTDGDYDPVPTRRALAREQQRLEERLLQQLQERSAQQETTAEDVIREEAAVEGLLQESTEIIREDGNDQTTESSTTDTEGHQ